MSSSASLLSGTPAQISASLLPAGGGGAQTLSQSGNNVLLSGGGGSVDVSTTTTVSATAVKTTAMTYDSGFLNTSFDGQVRIANNLDVGSVPTPATVTVFGTVEPTTITDSLASVGTAGQVLSSTGSALEWVASGGGGGGVTSISAGSNIAVDSTIPSAPVVSVAISADLDMNAQDILDAGSITCGTLNYTTLNPPVSGGSGTVTSVAVGANGLVLTGSATVNPTISLPATTSVGEYLVSNGSAYVTAGDDVKIGTTSTTGALGVSIGYGAKSVTQGVAIGRFADSIGVGAGSGVAGVALGNLTVALGGSLALGQFANAQNVNSIVLNAQNGLSLTSASASLYVKPVIAKTTETDVLYYNATSGLVSYGAGGGGGGGVASVAVGANGLVQTGTATDPILSLPTATATVGQYLVSDATGNFVVKGDTVNIGTGSSAGSDAVAIGMNASAVNVGTAIGANASAGNAYSVAIGQQANASFLRSIVLSADGSLVSAQSSLYVKPVVAKTTETDVLYYDATSGLVSYGAGGGGGGGVASVAVGANGLVLSGTATDPILSLPTAGAVVGQYLVTDATGKFVVDGATVHLGNGSASAGANSVAIGVSASSAGLDSIAIGNSAVSAGEGCVSYGYGAQTNLLHDIAIGSGSACPPNFGPPLPVPQAGINRIAIGNEAVAYGENCISIGHTISNTIPNSIVIGNTVNSVFLESLYVKPIALNVDSTNILYYNESNGLVTYGAGGGGGGGVTSITAGSNISVDSTIPSAPVVAVSISSALDMNSQNITDALNVGCVTATVGQALNYVDSGSVICADTKAGFYQGLLCQNKSSTDHASANVVCVNDSLGSDYSALGINSSVFGNLYNTVFEIPNATYISGTADTVVGSQSDHVVSGNHSLYLAYNSGEGAFCINTQGALSMNASNPAGVLDKGDFGTAGQLLTSAGSSAPPTWENPPALLTILGATVGDAPLNTAVPATWMSVTVNGGSYRIPLYQ